MAASRQITRRLLWRALSVRNQRVWVVFFALMVSTAIVNALVSVYFDIDIKMSRELRTFGANFYLGPAHGHTLPEADFDRLVSAAPPGLVAAGSPYLYGTARSELENVALAGVRFSALPALVPYWQVEGAWIGVDFDDRNAMIGRTLASRLNLAVGDTLSLVKDGQKKALRIKGIVDAGDASDSLLFISLELAQDWLEKPGLMSHALFSMMNSAGNVEQFAAALRTGHADWAVRPIRKVSANEGNVLVKIQGLMGLVSIVILLLSTLCVNTSLTAIVSERQREFALQKALGAANRTIVRQVLLETLAISLAATVVGCLAGFVLAQVLGQTVFSASIGLRAWVLPITVALSLSAALGAAVLPLRRIMYIQPARVLKGE
ncbi:MAG: ABC transporter permease [Candidatus Dactylopiibacterium carminicum]|uniref:ABC transporter permease n=1 Tax=Candidatus Dactylopiibacterium carminicum TaxID=857335 RepID=A0A272EWU0_9RHOO|nr:FtsX-like permease family protein [Candidatus Dactylopiibacterium carminicum]KAF7600028.1 ABC transporter permease [Candidatus Dactylopiibacterium carminicum]PAS94582.1 MAG: ABC transporter permease [Candidatus Dactylopiibacterium carminicum]PAS97622.1 MAG: ABC transporter permease [Candidatus Dactylopiibacterium carminicum]PAT00032.1 MAG: ABC transporter permease [Candidatus Dactylopiibacterium carminicum]